MAMAEASAAAPVTCHAARTPIGKLGSGDIGFGGIDKSPSFTDGLPPRHISPGCLDRVVHLPLLDVGEIGRTIKAVA